MVAVEHGKKTILGDIFNDAPDRIADILILIGASHLSTSVFRYELGWLCALLAVLTAYLRTLAGAVGAKQRFLGPMAKQHRMFVITAACAVLALTPPIHCEDYNVMDFALLIVAIGSVITCYRRLRAMVTDLKEANA